MISTLKFPKVSFTGWGSIEKLYTEIENFKPEKILLVTDQTLVNIGIIDKFISPLKESYNLGIYTDVEPEPSLLCGQRLVEYTRKGEYDCVIGLGGGSTLDLAKMCAVVSKNEGNVEDYLNLNGTKQLVHEGIPKILIPTTSGTGSEVTDISVFSLESTKDVITHEFLLASIAIVDPQLTITVPQRITAATGIDALTHAVESFVSVNSNHATEALALKAIELIGKSLEKVVENGEDVQARTLMSYGSYLAGLSFFNAGVAGVHALAYPLGSQYKLPHGESNAVLLPYVMKFISSSCKEKMNIICNVLSGEQNEYTEEDVFEVFSRLIEKVGLPSTLEEYKIPESAIEDLTEDAIKQKRLLSRSPKLLDKPSIYKIYQHAYKGNG